MKKRDEFFGPMLTWVSASLVTWLEMMGRCPSVAQDPSIHAWACLQGGEGRAPWKELDAGGGWFGDDPHSTLAIWY